MEQLEKVKTAKVGGAAGQGAVEKDGGSKPSYTQLSRLRHLVDNNHEDVEVYTRKLQEYEDTRPAKEILQARSKFAQGLDGRLGKAVTKREILEAVEAARKAVDEQDVYIASVEA